MNPNSPFSGFISVFFLFVLLNVGIASSADASCTDSDGGKFFYDKGKVTGVLSNGDTYANDDYCVSGSKVMEYYCFDKINPLAISEECGEGKTCKDGACIKKETSVPKCTDTDGSNLNKKGTVSGTTLDGTQYSESDSCSADGGVNEFVCTPTGYKTAKLSCGEGKTCKDGACVAVTQTCTETDEGSILDKKGTVSGIDASGAKYSYTDSCDGTVNVKEYYCVSGAMSESLNSPYAYAIKSCETGYSCSNGACVSKQKACTIGTAYSTEVNDPESAKLPTIAGEVKIFYYDGTSKTYTDGCSGDEKSVINYKCADISGVTKETLKCENVLPGSVCTKGACVKTEESVKCTDSDGGKKYYKKGTATVPNVTTATDSCSEDGFLNEMYCSSDKFISSQKFTCPQGYKCSDGACVKKSASSAVPKSAPLVAVNVSIPVSSSSSTTTCTDTDGGDNKNKKGTTTIYNSDGSVKASASDGCVDTSTISEGTCNKDGSDWVYSPEKCPVQYSCKDGACWKKSVVSTKCVDSDGGAAASVKGVATTTTTFDDGTSDSVSLEDKCIIKGGANYVKEIYCDSKGNIMAVQKKCPGYSSICSNGACKSGSSSASNNSSGNLKKTKLREFLLASGIENNEGVPAFLKPWRFTTGSLLGEIFQDE